MFVELRFWCGSLFEVLAHTIHGTMYGYVGMRRRKKKEKEKERRRERLVVSQSHWETSHCSKREFDFFCIFHSFRQAFAVRTHSCLNNTCGVFFCRMVCLCNNR